MKLISIAVAMIATTLTTASAAPFVPSDADIDLVKTTLSQQMLDPESTIVSEVLAAEQKVGDDTMVWVCGKVRGKNTFGGYTQPRPFVGSIVQANDGGRLFVPIKIAGPSNNEQMAVLQLCLSKLGG